MNVDLEAGGALATAGLAAHEIDAATKSVKTNDKGATKRCANCNAELRGRFCYACGQSAHVHRSLWHMFEEVLHGVLHFDTKSWRTLPLLFARPGLLTRRYIEGQRVKYVSPLALFLFCTFLMFFGLSMLGSSNNVINIKTESTPAEARAELVSELEAAKKSVAEKSAALSQAATDANRSELAEELRDAVTDQQVADTVLATFDKTTAFSDAIKETGSVSQGLAAAAKKDQDFNGNINTGNVKLDDVIRRARDNPELAMYKLKNTAYKFSFMLIPISLPFLWLMFFWRRGVTVYDHAVFSLYSLSFMSLFVVLIALLSEIKSPKLLIGILATFPALHMFLHLRETYSLSFGSTLWRTFALMLIAGTVFVLFLLMVIVITVT